MRLTVISKNEKKKEINIVVVHSLDDAYEEAQNAMDNGFDKAVIEDEVHNTIFSCVKAKKTNFDRITRNPEGLAEFIIDKLQYCKRPVCPICPVWKKCDGVGKDTFVEWLNEESKE